MGEGVAGMLALPTELTENVLVSVHARRDLLSLALTCSVLRNIIIPEHLHYHTIVASELQTLFWAFLVIRPDLARNIRHLTLHEDPMKKQWRLPPSFQVLDGLSALLALRGTAGWSYAEARVFGRTILIGVLQNMSHLQTLDVRADRYTASEGAYFDNDLIDIVCRSVPTTESLYVTYPGTYLLPFSFLPQLTNAHHPLFSMFALRTLDLEKTWMETDLWNSLCGMLSLSPQLQSLSFPFFKSGASTSTFDLPGTLCADMPFLSCLTYLRVPSHLDISQIADAVLAMLLQEPPITELRWGCTTELPGLDQPFPTLPNLCDLQRTNMSFVSRFLYGRPIGSVRLRKLDCIGFTFQKPLLFDALSALDSQALRLLHIPFLDSMRALRAIAHMFPFLEELAIPKYCGFMRPGPFTRTARVVGRAITLAKLRGVPLRTGWGFVPMSKVITLFPTLHTIHHVDTGNYLLNEIGGINIWCRPQTPPVEAAKAVSALRKRYPRILVVNNWKLA